MFGMERKLFSKTSQRIATKDSLTDSLIFHQIPWSIQGRFKHLIIPVTDFSNVPNVTTYLDQPLSGLTFQVQILQHINMSISCLTLVLRDQSQFTLGPHSISDFLKRKIPVTRVSNCLASNIILIALRKPASEMTNGLILS